jgi:hypothetical protein
MIEIAVSGAGSILAIHGRAGDGAVGSVITFETHRSASISGDSLLIGETRRRRTRASPVRAIAPFGSAVLFIGMDSFVG